jgi:hypothetical protein
MDAIDYLKMLTPEMCNPSPRVSPRVSPKSSPATQRKIDQKIEEVKNCLITFGGTTDKIKDKQLRKFVKKT